MVDQSAPAFGSFVRAKRLQSGIGLSQLAACLGVSNTYWCFVEAGTKGPPRDDLILSAARLLRIPSDELFIVAGRLPPDMKPHLQVIVSDYRQRRSTKIDASKLDDIRLDYSSARRRLRD